MKIGVFILLLSTVSFWGHAQTTQIGLRMGQTISNFQGDSTEDYDIRLTYHIGVSGAFHFRNNLSLQAEAFFSRQGAEYDKFNNDDVFKYDYIQIPVTVRYRFIRWLGIDAGPQLGINVGNRYILNRQKLNNDNINRFVFSIAMGGNINLGANAIMTIRYNKSLSAIANNSHLKNSFFTFSYVYYLGYNDQYDY